MRRAVTLLVIAAAAVGIGAALSIFRPHLPAAERGRRLAESMGCFGCHGPGGTRGAMNPGRTDKTVPNFEGDVMMFASGAAEIHEWIHDGVTARRQQSATWRAQRESGILKMPAFRGNVSEDRIADLVAYVMAMSGSPSPEDSIAARGLERADSLGCTGCHGAGGRLARANPGSLKGYVPSWDGADFPDLVRSRDEFKDWVEDGVSDRFEHDALAQFFLRRAVLKMPAFEKHLQPGDVDALWAYVQWLRSAEGSPLAHGTHEASR
ncbi:MAG TPA: c-type cytochrome [Candidatus Binatia bacterium]|nr:c-type cytochrome [Candidatus Binatia bacterium]